ncbi:hypothetical protein FACS1894218_4110 [Bacilli bacterium]|nr:hypothetical protein FACS1894218_4110 [Bacilli bacterium]
MIFTTSNNDHKIHCSLYRLTIKTTAPMSNIRTLESEMYCLHWSGAQVSGGYQISLKVFQDSNHANKPIAAAKIKAPIIYQYHFKAAGSTCFLSVELLFHNMIPTTCIGI